MSKLSLSNEDVCSTIAFGAPEGASQFVRFQLPGDKSPKGPFILEEGTAQSMADNSTNWLTVSSYFHPKGEPLCMDANYFAGLHLLALTGLADAEAEELNARAPCSFVWRLEDKSIEAVYVLSDPALEMSDAKALVRWADSRYPGRAVPINGFVRLPVGSAHAPSSVIQVIEWQPSRRYDRWQLQQAFKQSEVPKPVVAEPKVPGVEVPFKERAVSALTKFSLQGHLEDVEKLVSNQPLLFGKIIAENQATCIYAAPSTGKTLVMQHLAVERIASKGIDPRRIHYINMDDNPAGLLEKGNLAEEYGFHMLADGHRDFSIKKFHQTFREMVANRKVDGAILILDTLKKFVDTMSKSEARQFTSVVRQFVALGGTVIALAHTNKNAGSDGKPVYSGTTDILDDFDCVYILSKVPQQVDSDRSVVVFENKKSRGSVALTAAYESASAGELSYAEKLASVKEVDPEQWKPLLGSEEERSDAELIRAVEGAISAGVTLKMTLARDVSSKTGASRQRAISVIERYAAPECESPRWRYTRKARGAHHYELVSQPTQPSHS